MRVIKDLVRYDTDKAIEIASLEGDAGTFILYKTGSGNWFTYHEIHNTFTSLTEHEAALLIEKCSEWELLEEHFGHLIKDA